jgi:hypothetical protein
LDPPVTQDAHRGWESASGDAEVIAHHFIGLASCRTAPARLPSTGLVPTGLPLRSELE